MPCQFRSSWHELWLGKPQESSITFCLALLALPPIAESRTAVAKFLLSQPWLSDGSTANKTRNVVNGTTIILGFDAKPRVRKGSRAACGSLTSRAQARFWTSRRRPRKRITIWLKWSTMRCTELGSSASGSDAAEQNQWNAMLEVCFPPRRAA